MDLIDRKALLKQIEIDSDGEPGYYGDTWKFIDTIKNLPSATDNNVGTEHGTNLASLGTDCISRQAAIDLLKQMRKDGNMIPWEGKDVFARIRKLPPAQPEPANNSPKPANDSGELIDRQMAIDAVCMEWCNVKHQDCKHPFDDENDDYYWCDGCETVLRTLPDLPSAQPERIKARWILAENQRPEDMENDNYLFVCSNCGSTDLHSKRVPVPYCWNCGAEMLREVAE